MMSKRWVQYTLCTVYTRYKHAPSTASIQDCLSSLQTHIYKLTVECSVSFRCATLNAWQPWFSSRWKLKCKVTSSHSVSCKLTYWWIESQHPVGLPSNLSKYSSKLTPSAWNWILNLTLSLPASASRCSLNCGLPVYHQTWLITASRQPSEFTRFRPPSSSPTLLHQSLPVAQSWPPSPCPHFGNYGLQVDLYVHFIMTSWCLSNLTSHQPSQECLCSQNNQCRVYL